MGLKVELKHRESSENLIRRFEKMIEKSGIMKEMRRREAYEKPSDKNRRQKLRSQKNIERERRLAEQRERTWVI